MEFWNSQLTQRSWEILQEINKKYDFILIGGWATYLHTKQQKSKDIDIIIDINELQKFKNENLSKNENLKKYEVKYDDVDLDIYVELYSKLALPVNEMKNYTIMIEGFKVLNSEALVILKQGAELDRGHSIKGEKDRVDIISLLFFSNFDIQSYYSILKKFSMENYFERLKNIVKRFSDYNRLSLTPRELKLKKENILKEMKNV